MKRFVLAVLTVAACTDEQNIGNTYTLRTSRWSIAIAGIDAVAERIAIDRNGDVIVTGARAVAGFVAKRSGSDGAELWTQPFGAGNFDIEGFALDAADNVFLAGRTSGTQQLGDLTVVTNPTRFVAELTPAGHTEWVRTFDADPVDIIGGFAVAADGSYYVSTARQLIAFAPDGFRRWTQEYPAAGPIALTSDGAIEMAASLNRSTTFGTFAIDLQHDSELVVARLAPDGSVTRVRPYGEAGVLYGGTVVALDHQDRLAVTTRGGSQVQADTNDFVVSATGDELWRKSPVSGATFSHAVATNGNAVLTAGQLPEGQIDLGGGVQAGGMYIAARDAHGDLVDLRVFGDPPSSESFWGLAMGERGEVAYTATITSPVDFGNGRLAGPGAVIGMFGR